MPTINTVCDGMIVRRNSKTKTTTMELEQTHAPQTTRIYVMFGRILLCHLYRIIYTLHILQHTHICSNTVCTYAFECHPLCVGLNGGVCVCVCLYVYTGVHLYYVIIVQGKNAARIFTAQINYNILYGLNMIEL